FVHTGTWTSKALGESTLYGDVEVVASSADAKYSYIPRGVRFSENASYAHIASNNTIYGTEWHEWPEVPEGVPLVCDFSSDLMARETSVKDFGVIFAGAQKNLGPAGVTLVIVREDLIDRVPDDTPTLLKWKTEAEKNSLFHTPPCFAIYVCKLALDYWKGEGGVAEVEKRNRAKAKLLYDIIDTSKGFYKGHAREDSRSLMNVTFRLPSEELEKKVVDEGTARGLVGLKGHRSVGGMRASIYNAMPKEGVEALADFLVEFKEENE
ncbi:MAG: 3-phosphoserine/phosphohydroxythreonine transaminase, partial [Candidatus Thorarchaeota archaeon]